MEAQLSWGAVTAIWEDPAAVSVAGLPVVLQVMNLRPWPDAPGSGWRAMLLSDGHHFISAALPPYVAASPAALSMREGAVVHFPNFELRVEVRKRLIIPKELVVLQTEWMTIGNPKLYQPAHWEGNHEELNPQLASRSESSSSSELSTGAYSAGQGLKELLTPGVVAMFEQPVMQVVSVMRSGQGNLEKFHLVLSDGVHTQNATLASHLNRLVKNSHLRMGTIVRLLEFICNSVQNPSMVSVVQLEVLQTDCELIGRSKAYEQPYGLQVKCGELYHGSVPNYAQPDSASYSSGEGLNWLLTQGAVEAMLESKMAVEQQPVMQVVDVSTVSRGKITVYCVLLSDGVYQEHALLCPDAYPLAELRNGSIVRILRFKFNTLNSDTRINYKALIVKLEILQMECKLIGRPRFHERGLKHKEKEPYLKHAANVPVLPEQSYLSVLGASEDATKLSDQFHPGYKSMPD